MGVTTMKRRPALQPGMDPCKKKSWMPESVQAELAMRPFLAFEREQFIQRAAEQCQIVRRADVVVHAVGAQRRVGAVGDADAPLLGALIRCRKGRVDCRA